jgi:hypothetical protein
MIYYPFEYYCPNSTYCGRRSTVDVLYRSFILVLCKIPNTFNLKNIVELRRYKFNSGTEQVILIRDQVNCIQQTDIISFLGIITCFLSSLNRLLLALNFSKDVMASV